MEGKRIALIVLLLVSLQASAQFGQSRQVTFRAHATLAPGFLLGEGEGVVSVVGDAEYFLSNRTSWRADGAYYLLSFGDETFNMNHGLYSGLCFRPSLRNFAPYVGFQPGVHLTQLKARESLVAPPVSVVPVVSGITGFHFFFLSFLHISAGVRVLHGTAYYFGSHPVTEMRAWLGLGWQITTARRKFDD